MNARKARHIRHLASRLDTAAVYVPVSKWNEFKLRRFPKWLLKLFPARTQKAQLNTAHLCRAMKRGYKSGEPTITAALKV